MNQIQQKKRERQFLKTETEEPKKVKQKGKIEKEK